MAAEKFEFEHGNEDDERERNTKMLNKPKCQYCNSQSISIVTTEDLLKVEACNDCKSRIPSKRTFINNAFSELCVFGYCRSEYTNKYNINYPTVLMKSHKTILDINKK